MTSSDSIARPDPARHVAPSTSSVLSLRALLAAFTRRGGRSSLLLRRIGVPGEALRQLDARIPFDSLLLAWELAPQMVGDVAFGLHLGASLQRGAFGLVEYVARTSATLGAALERLVRYQRLLHDRAHISLTASGSIASLAVRIAHAQRGAPRHFNEALMAALIAFARDVTGTDLVPLEVFFQHGVPGSIVEHQRLLRAPLQFGAPLNQIVMPRSVLDLGLREADAALVAVLDRCAEQALDRLPPALDPATLCRDLIASQIGAGLQPRVGYIARELALSPRSLQRLLRGNRLTFSDLVVDVRRELALAWVTSGDCRAAQIAYRLGYAEASAFHHAFRRWTGYSVGDFRRKLALGQPR